MDLQGKNILLTGGSGSFGKEFVRMTLANFSPRRIVIFSRAELKQWEMQSQYADNPKVRFFIGDIRDKDRLWRALEGIDLVVHAAAAKIVATAEYDPFEAVKTNVIGAMNLIDVALDRKVAKVIALSSEKASGPVSLIGATQLASEKLFTAANSYSGANGTKFAVVRCGEVMGSSNSSIPRILEEAGSNSVNITHPEMTKFVGSTSQGVELVWKAVREAIGGEILVGKMKSMRLIEIVEAIAPGRELHVTGIKPGEKLHEQIIGLEDAPRTFDFGDHYRIYPASGAVDGEALAGNRVPEGFSYTSNNQDDWMSAEQLRDLIERNDGLSPWG